MPLTNMPKAIFVKRGFHQFHPSRSQKRPWKQVLVLVVVLLLVVGLVPVHLSSFDQRLQKELDEIFGGAATFGSTKIHLLTGMYVSDFKLLDQRNGKQVVFSCPMVRFKINPLWYMLTGSFGLYLQEPNLAINPDASGRWRIPQSLSGAFPKETTGSSSLPAKIIVENGTFECNSSSGKRILGQNLDLLLSRITRDGRKPIDLRGDIQWEGQNISVDARGGLDILTQTAAISGTIHPATQEKMLLRWPDAMFETSELAWRAEVSRQGQHFDIGMTVNPDESSKLLFAGSQTALQIKEGIFKVRYDKTASKLILQDSSLAWDGRKLALTGEVALGEIQPFRISASSSDLPADFVKGILNLRYPNRTCDLVSGSLGVQLEASGLISNVTNTVYQGQLAFHNCAFQHLPTGFQISDVSGGVSLYPDEAVFSQVQAQYAEKRLAIDGSIKGSPLFWINPTFDLTVKGEIDLRQTGKLLRDIAPSILTDVQSAGTAKLDLQIKGPASDFEKMLPEGTISLHEVSLAGGVFPVPFNQVGGTLILKAGALQIDSLQASTGQTSIQIKGSWTRGADSWSNGTANLAIKGTAEAKEIFPAVTRLMPVYLGGYNMSGQTAFDLAVSGPVNSPTLMLWQGTASVKEGTLGGGVFKDNLSEVTGEVGFKSNNLSSLSLRWRRNSVPGRFTYDIKTAKNSVTNNLALRADFRLDEVKEFASKYLKYDTTPYTVSGGVFIDIGESWPDGQPSKSITKGRIDFEGGKIENAKWPLPVENLEGIVKIEGSQYLTDQLSVSSGDAKTMLKGVYQNGTWSVESLNNLDLATVLTRLEKLYPEKYKGWVAGGAMAFVLKSAPPAVPDATDAKRTYEGELSFLDALLKTSLMDQAVEKIQGTIHFTNSTARASDLGFSIGETQARSSFLLEDFEQPKISGSVSASLLQVDTLTKTLKGMAVSPTQPAPAKPWQLQSITGTLKADKFHFSRLEGAGLHSDVSVTSENGKTYFLTMTDVGFSALNGTVMGKLEMALAASGMIYSASLEAKNMALQDALGALGDTKNKDLNGLFDLSAEFRGEGQTLDGFTCKGQFEGRNVSLVRNDVFSRLAEAANLNMFREIAFERITTPFLMIDKRIFTEDMRWLGNVAEMKWQGSLGLDKTLNYSVTAAISASNVPGVNKLTQGENTGPLFKFLTAKSIDLGITGTLDAPQIALKPLKTLIRPAKELGQIVIVPVGNIIKTVENAVQATGKNSEQPNQ